MTYLLFTLPACCRCPAVKNYLISSGAKGQVIDASTEAGMNRARVLSVSSTPTVIFFDDNQNEIGRAYDIAKAKEFVEAK